MPNGVKIDEFAFVLFAGLLLILILTIGWSTTNMGVVEVSPTDKTLTIARGSSSTFTIHLNGTASNVNLTGTGDIASWMSFDRNNFDINGPLDAHVSVIVPYSAQTKYYSGRVEIDFVGGKKTVSVSVNVSTVTVTESSRRVFGPEDFTVSYSVGTETVSEKRAFTVERGLFVDNYKKFTGILTQEKLSMVTGGLIYLVIDDTNSVGNLIVEFNGQEVYNDNPDLGEVSIELDKNQIQKTNVIIVRADSPGLKFWTNNFYEIGRANFGIDYQGISFRDFTFTLDSNDITNFKLGRLSFRVANYDPSRPNDMIVKINGQTTFRLIPTLGYYTETFGTEIPLSTGSNTISFSVGKEASYELEDVTLTIIRNV